MYFKSFILFISFTIGTSYAQSVLPISAHNVTVLPAFDAVRSEGLKPSPHQNLDNDPKIFAVEGWKQSNQHFTWHIDVPRKGVYKIALLYTVKKLTEPYTVVLELTAGKEQTTIASPETDWNKTFFEKPIYLQAGVQTIQLGIKDIPAGENPELGLYSLEIASEASWKSYEMAVNKLRTKNSWLDKAHYGLFFHWNARSQPEHGAAKSYTDAVADFDVKKFSGMVHETGADFIVLTTSWDLQTFPAPLQSLDRLMPGNTTPRDLISDLAEALAAYKIKLLVYCNFRINRIGWKKEDRAIPGKTEYYFDQIATIYEEIGERYAGKIGGVWIDDGMGLYPHNASIRKFTELIKQHDSSMVVGYNSWIYPRFTDFQDFFGGEHGITMQSAGVGNTHLPVGGSGYYISGPQQGLKATFCGLLEPGDWTHITPNQKIPSPSISADKLITIVQEAVKRKNLPVMNVSVYQDGRISPETFSLLKQLKETVKVKNL